MTDAHDQAATPLDAPTAAGVGPDAAPDYGAAPELEGPQHKGWQAAEQALSEMLPHFEARPGQRRMMAAVAEALWHERDVVVEAGTGTGKTLAYLLPLLSAGQRVLISTATRQLQGQLVDHDLPVALQATGAVVDVAVLKGRSNYLCHTRVASALTRHAVLGGALSPALIAISDVLHKSRSGDIAEVSGVDDRHPIWPEVTSTSDNCQGTDCAAYADCFVVQARRRALQAQVIVVNHHILLADYALRERFDGAALLPAVDAIVIDEAHALEDVASRFFGTSLSSNRVDRLRRDIVDALTAEDAADPGSADAAHTELRALGTAAADLFADARRLAGSKQLDDMALVSLQAGREPLHRACDRLWTQLGALSGSAALDKAQESLAALQSDLGALLAPELGTADGLVRWVEQRPRSTAIVARPVQVAPVLRRTLLAERSVRVFTSATLAVGDDFTEFTARLGIADTVPTLRVPGAFDYERQALLYLPRHLPAPFAAGREHAVATEIARLVQASAGGAFALFSSRRGMRDAHARLQSRLPFTALLQGDESREALLERFVDAQPAVLFATMGFWQGVDLPGDVLRLVILDKIPFPPPDDPLFAARAAAVEAEGGSSFSRLSVPAAALALRQGFGRLIRSQQDSGVVAILDPRMVRRGYGKRLVKALPPAARTQHFDDVAHFFARFHADRPAAAPAQPRAPAAVRLDRQAPAPATPPGEPRTDVRQRVAQLQQLIASPARAPRTRASSSSSSDEAPAKGQGELW